MSPGRSPRWAWARAGVAIAVVTGFGFALRLHSARRVRFNADEAQSMGMMLRFSSPVERTRNEKRPIPSASLLIIGTHIAATRKYT